MLFEKKKGFYLFNVWLLCKCARDFPSHLIYCSFSWEVWCRLARDFGITFIASLNLVGLLESWHS